MINKGRVFRLAIVIATVALIFVLVFIAQKGRPMERLGKSDGDIESIKSTRNEAGDRIESGISFNGFELFYDRYDDAYYYSLVEGTNESYRPAVSVTGAPGRKLDIAFAGEAITDELISGARPLKALVYNDSEYREVKIYCTTLPIVEIECADEVDDEESPMRIKVFDNRAGAANRVVISDGSIHVRGNTSALYDKKGYKIKLTEKSPGRSNRERDAGLLGMRKDGDWLLYAAYNDEERIRNVFSANLWYDTCAADSRFGIMNGYEYRYTELIINGEYRGLYALGYPPDKKQMALGPGETTFQKTSADSELNIDFDDLVSVESAFEVRYGDFDEEDEGVWSPLANYYKYLQGLRGAEDGLYTVCDPDNAEDIFLFVNLIQAHDCASEFSTLNINQTFKSARGGNVCLYTPWDLDRTWGNVWDSAKKNFTCHEGDASVNCLMKLNPVYFLIMYGDDEALSSLKDKYAALRAGGWSDDALSEMIDLYEKQIFSSGAYLRDVERWPASSRLDDPSTGLARFKEYVMERLGYMDSYIDALSCADINEEYTVYSSEDGAVVTVAN
ncbi:MAG: CotH kinase family protein [Clostridia bacterium]|nr:CotH kinase family protein [Clostridia bacterium]